MSQLKLKIITEIDRSNSAFDDYEGEMERILEGCKKRTLEFVDSIEDTGVRVSLFDSNGNKVGSIEILKDFK